MLYTRVPSENEEESTVTVNVTTVQGIDYVSLSIATFDHVVLFSPEAAMSLAFILTKYADSIKPPFQDSF